MDEQTVKVSLGDGKEIDIQFGKISEAGSIGDVMSQIKTSVENAKDDGDGVLIARVGLDDKDEASDQIKGRESGVYYH